MRSKGGVTGGEGDEGIFFSLFDFCFIEALLYNEECHSVINCRLCLSRVL